MMAHTPPPSLETVARARKQMDVGRWALIVGGVLAIVAALIMGYLAGRYLDERDAAKKEALTEGQQKEALEREREMTAQELLAVCEGTGPASKKLQEGPLCQRAKDIRETDPVDLIVPIELVREAVRAELRENPPPAGRSPTPEDILPAVRSEVNRWLRANPPEDGEDGRDGSTPSDRRLLVLIRQVYAENPPEDGQDGATGPQGPIGPEGPQGAQGVPGDKGDKGDPGRSVVSFDMRDVNEQPGLRECVWFITYDDGTEQQEPADDAACEDGQ